MKEKHQVIITKTDGKKAIIHEGNCPIVANAVKSAIFDLLWHQNTDVHNALGWTKGKEYDDNIRPLVNYKVELGVKTVEQQRQENRNAMEFQDAEHDNFEAELTGNY